MCQNFLFFFYYGRAENTSPFAYWQLEIPQYPNFVASSDKCQDRNRTLRLWAMNASNSIIMSENISYQLSFFKSTKSFLWVCVLDTLNNIHHCNTGTMKNIVNFVLQSLWGGQVYIIERWLCALRLQYCIKRRRNSLQLQTTHLGKQCQHNPWRTAI